MTYLLVLPSISAVPSFFASHHFRALWTTGAMLALASTASSQGELTADPIKAIEPQALEALKNRRTVDEKGAFGIAREMSVFPIEAMAKELEVKDGSVSLLPDLKDHGGGKAAVYLLNATDEPLKDVYSQTRTCLLEVKIGDRWKICQIRPFVCGTGLQPPDDLAAGHGMLLLGRDPAGGDVTGELRYLVGIPHGRPIVSESFLGRYKSKELELASPPGGFAGQAITSGLDGQEWTSHSLGPTVNTSTPEECLAAAELDRAYDESPLTQTALSRWKATPPAGEGMAECLTVVQKLLQGPWDRRTDAPALFQRAHAALARPRGKAEFGSPENCRALIWRYLERVPAYMHPTPVNPERWDQLEAIRHSGNPWGVDRNLVVALLEEAIASLQSSDAAEREAAGSLLKGRWITPDYLPDERWSFVLEQDSASARGAAIAALKQRGKGQLAGKWLADHLQLPANELGRLWEASIQDYGRFAEWESSIALKMLETSPLEAAFPLAQRQREITEAGGVFPADFHEPLRIFLAKEADEKRFTGPPPPDQREPGAPQVDEARQLDCALCLLATWNDPADTPLIMSYLAHPAAEYENSGYYIRRYQLRVTAAKLLKERNEQVPEGIVFKERVK